MRVDCRDAGDLEGYCSVSRGTHADVWYGVVWPTRMNDELKFSVIRTGYYAACEREAQRTGDPDECYQVYNSHGAFVNGSGTHCTDR